jgi:anti-sigma factor RsiW
MKWCRCYRMVGRLFPEPRGWWSGMVDRHVDRCAECRRELAHDRALIQGLRRSAPPVASEMPPFLKARILANLDRGDGGVREGVKDGWRWLRPWAMAGVCLLLLVALWPRQYSGVLEMGNSVSPPMTELLAHDQQLRPWLTGPSEVWRWAELAGQPLEGELANAVDDGRRLFAAAVQSVVPDAAAEAILAHTDHWMSPAR